MPLTDHPDWTWQQGMRDANTGERYTCRWSAQSWQPSPTADPAVPDLDDPMTAGILALDALGPDGVAGAWVESRERAKPVDEPVCEPVDKPEPSSGS